MKGLRSSLFMFSFFLILSTNSNLIAQCSSSSCTNSNPYCEAGGFNDCCESGGNPNSINSTPVATVDEVGNYNCHQFVKAYLYGGYTGQAILDCDNGSSDCPCKEYKNGSFTDSKEFVQVQWESQAAAIYYPCDHSAVKLGSFQYMSKDGHGGHLYAHGPTAYAVGSGCYPYQFWAYLGGITGGTGALNSPFNLSLKNNNGVTYEWCANPSNMVTIANGNTANPTFTPIGNGSVQIKVKTTGFNGSTKTQCKNLTVSTPSAECGNLYINGTVTTSGYTSSLSSYNNIFSYYSKVNLNSSQASYYTWDKIAGNAGYNIGLNGKSANLYMSASQYLKFKIEAFNSANVCLGSRNVFFQCTTVGSGGGWWLTQSGNNPQVDELNNNVIESGNTHFNSQDKANLPRAYKPSIYPNPTRDILNIELPNHDIISISLFDMNGRNVLQEKLINSAKNHQINLTHLSPGIYYIRILDADDETIIKKILIE